MPAPTAPRLLIVTPPNPINLGGVERHVREVSQRLAAAGVSLSILCAEPGAQRHDYVLEGVPVRVLPAYPKDNDWYFTPALWRAIQRAAPDLIHVQSYHTFFPPLAMARARSLKIPYVLTFHGGGSSSELRNRMRTVQRAVQRPLYAGAARLVGLARWEIDTYVEEFQVPRDHFVLLPNGVDTSRFRAVADHRTAAVTDREAGVTLASIGRLERYKGHHRAIELLPELLKRRPNARVKIVGRGPYEAELAEIAAGLGVSERVEITSVDPTDADGMPNLMRELDFVVLLSEMETPPITAIEAAAARRRMLIADNGGLGELAEDGYGRGVPWDIAPGDAAAIIDDELSRPAPEKAPPVFNWDDCAADLIKLYEEILGRPLRPA